MTSATISATAAEIVIIGGGIIGCSIAYHLTRMGKRDVLILEKSGVTHGATWHAAGLVGQLRTSRNVTRMLQRSVELYDGLEQETGQAIDWKKVGSLRLACSEERLLEIRRSATMAKSFGLEMEIIGAKEAQALFPLMSTEGVRCGSYLASDGYLYVTINQLDRMDRFHEGKDMRTRPYALCRVKVDAQPVRLAK